MRVADEGIRALARSSEVFAHDGGLVWMVPTHDWGTALGDRPTAWRIEPLPAPRLRELLSRAARWMMPRSNDPADLVPTLVPVWVVRAIAARRRWPGLPVLTAQVKTPVLRPDGTALETPGYDAATGLLYAPDAAYPPIAAVPTRDDACRAAEEILACASEIPFVTPTDRSAWLASVLTPLARFAFTGPAPLQVFGAAHSHAVAADLVALTASIVGGRSMICVGAAELVSSRKRGADHLSLGGEATALLTDLTGPSAPGWPRVLAEFQRERSVHRVIWYVAGVESGRSRELAGACLRIALEPTDATRPHRHATASDPPRRRDVGARRGHLVVAALTLLRAWYLADRPDAGLAPWLGFEGWAQIVRNAVVWAGQADPLGAHDVEPVVRDVTREAVADLLAGWAEVAATLRGECSVRQALNALSEAPENRFARLRAAIGFFAPGRLDEWHTAARLGRVLARYESEEVEGRRLCLTGSGNEGNRWAVRALKG